MKTLKEWQVLYPDLKVRDYLCASHPERHDYLLRRFRYEDGRLIDRKTGEAVGGEWKKGRKNFWFIHMSRWIWFYHYGWLPDGRAFVIDHVDNDCSNDRIDNLQILPNMKNWMKGTTPKYRMRGLRSEEAKRNRLQPFYDTWRRNRLEKSQRDINEAFLSGDTSALRRVVDAYYKSHRDRKRREAKRNAA